MNIRRRVVTAVASAALIVPAAVGLFATRADAAWQNYYFNFSGSSGGTCGGELGVGTNLYGYPEATINTPALGWHTCYATTAVLTWNGSQTTVSGGGASAVAYGAQGGTPNYASFQGCPGIYNCSAYSGPYYP